MKASHIDDEPWSAANETKVTEPKKPTTKKRKRVPENLPDGNLFVELLNCKIKDIRPTETKDRSVFETNDSEIEQYCLYWNYHGDKKDREIVKKIARKVNNRISASKSRKSKSDQLEQLKAQIQRLEKEKEEYKAQIKQAEYENRHLSLEIEKFQTILKNMSRSTQANCVTSVEYNYNFEHLQNNGKYLNFISNEDEHSQCSNEDSSDCTKEFNSSADFSDFSSLENELLNSPSIDYYQDETFKFMEDNYIENEIFGSSYYKLFSKFFLVLLGLTILLVPFSKSTEVVELSTFGNMDFSGISNKVITIGALATLIYFKMWK